MLLRAPLLLLWGMLASLLPWGRCDLHSLHYFYLRLLEPSQGPPLSFIRGYLDDQPITRYDSLARRVEPMVSWMEELEKETFLPLEWVFRSEVEELSRLNPSTHEPPVGKMTRTVVDDTLETLICQAFGFYPKEIEATWMRDGENWEQETFRRTVAPNSDGTYYVWISIEIDPKERDRFQCHLEHDGLQEPLVLAWKEETATGWQIPVGIVASLILGAGILFLICRCWRRRTILSKEVRIAPRDFPLVQIARSNISDTERIKIRQLSLRRRYKMTMKDGTPYEPLRYQLDLKDPVLTLRKRKGKGQRLKRSLTWSGDTENLHQEVSRLKQLSWPKRE